MWMINPSLQAQEAALSVLGGQRNALDKQLPLADALVTAIRDHLPSPKVAGAFI
jgi:hypothetical protein